MDKYDKINLFLDSKSLDNLLVFKNLQYNSTDNMLFKNTEYY